MKRFVPVALALSIAAGSLTVSGQQNVPFQGGIPVAPKGLSGRKLPTLPVEFATGEEQRIRVTLVADGLANPWSIGFLPDGTILVTEREARLRVIRNGVLDPQPVAGLPAAHWAGEPGLPGAVTGYMDLAIHPQFAQNQFVYLAYSKPGQPQTNQYRLAILRGRWDGRAIVDAKDIWVADANVGSATRLAFDRNNLLYVTTSGNDPQSTSTIGGKVLRLKDDGTIPPDNPFAGRPGARGEIYTMGHRNSLGLAMHPGTGVMWQNENGPNGGDEINILKAGANYGWPIVSLGRTYTGPWQTPAAGPTHILFEPPIVYWMPAIAVSGMTFYTGDRLPKWKGDVFVASLRTGEIPGTGHIERILLNDKLEELRRESLLTEFRQRMRDIRQSPDGYLYVLTDEKPGAVLRIEPAN